MATDIWRQLGMTISFARWHGRNLDILQELSAKWEVSAMHVVRSTTYKGENEVSTLAGFRHDGMTTLGLCQVIGALAQVRGLAGTVQSKMLKILHEALRFSLFPHGLSFLPDMTFKVENGMTSMKDWLVQVPRKERASIKTRRGKTA